jgi:alpha-L-rhamnosidase
MYIPNWAMWYVIELYDYLNRTADRELIENSRHKVYGIIDYFKQYLNSDGLLEDLESWVFIEWSKSNDKEFVKGVNYPSNMLYSKMLCVAGTMYNDKELILQGQNIKKMVIEQSFNGKFFEDNRVRENGILVNKGHISETCQYYAFYFDVADVSNFSKLFKILINDFGPKRDCKEVYPYVYKSNAFIGNYLRFEILLKNSMELLVIDECKEFFYFMAERTGTLWEHSFAFGSLNHVFASIAAKYIVECTTGFIEVDNATKAVYLSEPAIECNVNVKIPVLDQFLEIVIIDKKRNIKLPENYFKECIN